MKEELEFDLCNLCLVIEQLKKIKINDILSMDLLSKKEGSNTSKEYMDKLESFVRNRVDGVKKLNNQYQLRQYYDQIKTYY